MGAKLFDFSINKYKYCRSVMILDFNILNLILSPSGDKA